MLRKRTKIQFCDRHAGWFAGATFPRKVECMLEGGPGGWSPGCSGGECKIWPGTDYIVTEFCDGSALDLEWTRA